MIKAAHCRIYWAQGLQVPPATQGHQKSAQSWRNRYIKSWCDSYWIRFIMLHLCLLLQLSDIWGSTRGSWFPSGFSSFWINMVGGWKTTGKKCNHWSIEVHQTLIHCWTNCTNSINMLELQQPSRVPLASVEINCDPWMSQLPHRCGDLRAYWISILHTLVSLCTCAM